MIFTRGLRVCLAVAPVDLRRSFEGLALLVREALHEDERSSQIFVFTNQRKNRIRLLYWDGTGLWLMTKTAGIRLLLMAAGARRCGEDQAAGGSAGDAAQRDRSQRARRCARGMRIPPAGASPERDGKKMS